MVKQQSCYDEGRGNNERAFEHQTKDPHWENSGDNRGRGNDEKTQNARRVLHHEADEDAPDRLCQHQYPGGDGEAPEQMQFICKKRQNWSIVRVLKKRNLIEFYLQTSPLPAGTGGNWRLLRKRTTRYSANLNSSGTHKTVK